LTQILSSADDVSEWFSNPNSPPLKAKPSKSDFQRAEPLALGFSKGSVWVFLAGVHPIVWVIAAVAVAVGVVILACTTTEITIRGNDGAQIRIRKESCCSIQ